MYKVRRVLLAARIAALSAGGGGRDVLITQHPHREGRLAREEEKHQAEQANDQGQEPTSRGYTHSTQAKAIPYGSG